MTSFVWLDDGLVTESDARVPINNRAFTSGDGVFEALKVVNGVPFALTRHLDRLANAAGRLGLECADDASLRDAIAQTIEANLATVGTLGRLRMTLAGRTGVGLDRAPGLATLVITLTPAITRSEYSSVITVSWPRNERALLAGVKTTSYAEGLAMLKYAQSKGADEALMPDTTGRLCEGTTCNVAIEYDGKLITPTLSTGCLPGVTRALALEWGIVEEHDVAIEELSTTSEVLITSSTRDLMVVDSVNGRALGVPGKLASAAIAEFHRNEAVNPDP